MTEKRYQHIEGRDLWLCPCAECIRIDYDALDDDRPTWSEFVRQAREDYENERAL